MLIKILEEQTLLLNLVNDVLVHFDAGQAVLKTKSLEKLEEVNSPWLLCHLGKKAFAIQALDRELEPINNALLALFLSKSPAHSLCFDGEISKPIVSSISFTFRIDNNLANLRYFRINISLDKYELLKRYSRYKSHSSLLTHTRIAHNNSISLKLRVKAEVFSWQLHESDIKKDSAYILSPDSLSLSIQNTNFELQNFSYANNFLSTTLGEKMNKNDLKLELGVDLFNFEISPADFTKLRSGTKLEIECPATTIAFLKIAEKRFAEVSIEFSENKILMQIENEFSHPIIDSKQETISTNWR